MDKNIFDLRQFREDRLHLTQKELAGLLDIRQDSVSRMEQNPDQISVAMLVKLARLAGQSLDEVVGYQPVQPAGLNVRRTWAAVQYRCADIQQRLKQEYGEPDSLLDPFNRSVVNTLGEQVTFLANNKPSLAVAGTILSGKSTFINSLLGQRLLPVNCISSNLRLLRIRHVDDRPEGTANTVFLYRRADTEDSDGENKPLMEGGPELLLSNGENPEVGRIEVYADSPILRNCDIVRLPSPDFEGTVDPASIGDWPDILVFLCSGIQPLSTSDASYFRLLLEQTRVLERKGRPEYGCLSNLFIVCTKAHLLGSQEQAQTAARQKIGSMLYNSLPPSFWEKREEFTGVFCTEDIFLSRCFIYAVQEDPSWRSQLENSLRATIERVPDVIWGSVSRGIVRYRDYFCQLADQRMEQPGPEPSEMVSSEEASLTPDRRKEIIQKQYWIMDNFDLCERRSVKHFWNYCLQEIAEANLREQLETFGKNRIQQLTTYLQTEMEREATDILRDESKKIMTDVEEYLSLLDSPEARDAFRNAMPELAHRGAFLPNIAVEYHLPVETGSDLQEEHQVSKSSYCCKRDRTFFDSPASSALGTMVGAVAGASLGIPGIVAGGILGTVGALGAFSNIFSGSSSSLSTVSSVSEAINAADTTTSDKKKIKSIQEAFRNKVIPVYEQSIRRFWSDTKEVFECAAQSAQEASDRVLQSDVPEVSISPEQRIKESSGLKGFFESLPL